MRNKPLSQFDITDLIKEFKIPNFKGWYMRDDLSSSLLKNECGILNLDLSSGNGTHWTTWVKNKKTCYYFDAFGLVPPKEFYKYMKCDIYHSTYKIQRLGDVICGHLCVLVLYLMTVCGLNFSDSLFFIINEC